MIIKNILIENPDIGTHVLKWKVNRKGYPIFDGKNKVFGKAFVVDIFNNDVYHA